MTNELYCVGPEYLNQLFVSFSFQNVAAADVQFLALSADIDM